jgi:hypothetical protein
MDHEKLVVLLFLDFDGVLHPFLTARARRNPLPSPSRIGAARLPGCASRDHEYAS